MNLVIAEIHGEETYGLLKDNYFYEVNLELLNSVSFFQ